MKPPDHQNFFTTGGTLRADAPSYIVRQADRDLLDGLLRNEFCYILTSRQMGKSSLMVQTAHALTHQQNVQVVVLDLAAFGLNVTPEQWYDGLAIRLGRQAKLEDEIEDYWQAHLRLGPCQRWFAVIRDVVLDHPKAKDKSLVIFVDELDVVRSLPFSSDEFLSAIRECHNRRNQDPALNRLAFCLLGAAAPHELMQDSRIAPFNVGHRVELADFTPAEAAPLARGLSQAAGVDTAKLLARILHWTHGHPYLTQKLCRGVTTATEPSDHGREDQVVDRVCEELFLSPRARETDDNMLFVRERLLRSAVDLNALLDLYEHVLADQPVRDNELDDHINQLRLSGIVRVHDQHLRVRNRIYRSVFDDSWIAINRLLAELEKPDGERVRVRAGLSLGRTDTNDIVLPDVKVSRRHAMIQKQGKDELWLADLGSRNGTFLNGARILRPTLLRDRDRIQVGPFTLTFHQANAPRTDSHDLSTIDRQDKTIGG